jgi:hypothetical protein
VGFDLLRNATASDNQRESGGVGQPSGADLVLLIKGQLLPEKQDLRTQRASRTDNRSQEAESVQGQITSETDAAAERA